MRARVQGIPLFLIIGANEWERHSQQEVLADLEIEFDALAAAESDDLAQTVDYSALTERVRAEAEKTSFQLLEALCRHLLNVILADPRILRATLTLTKPKALSHAVGVSVEGSGIRESGFGIRPGGPKG